MQFELSDEQRLIIDNVRRFIREEIRPLEPDLDPDAFHLKPEDHERLTQMTKDMGLYQMDVPEEFSGPGVDTVTRTLIAEEISQHRAGLYAPAYGVFGHGPQGQLYNASEEQKERYLWPTIRGEKSGFFGLIAIVFSRFESAVWVASGAV